MEGLGELRPWARIRIGLRICRRIGLTYVSLSFVQRDTGMVMDDAQRNADDSGIPNVLLTLEWKAGLDSVNVRHAQRASSDAISEHVHLLLATEQSSELG